MERTMHLTVKHHLAVALLMAYVVHDMPIAAIDLRTAVDVVAERG